MSRLTERDAMLMVVSGVAAAMITAVYLDGHLSLVQGIACIVLTTVGSVVIWHVPQWLNRR